jgi:hypothetical protein
VLLDEFLPEDLDVDAFENFNDTFLVDGRFQFDVLENAIKNEANAEVDLPEVGRQRERDVEGLGEASIANLLVKLLARPVVCCPSQLQQVRQRIKHFLPKLVQL